jgi:hypothetical protein
MNRDPIFVPNYEKENKRVELGYAKKNQKIKTAFTLFFLLLAQKKVTKEKGSLRVFLGLTFFRLPTHYNSFATLTQTVMLTYTQRSQPQKC